ncbi:single-stranded-DNA-specific exonuclease RecJ [Rhodothermus marinus]|uniref:single-stranded-DNA-specific exonuclease RecJ n=1 Tax=Rhodothermus marinus TaxID=29549 RepID=UPI0012BA457C|nr:single-stranded-DNA-specific exonuclease RecJ [Rhodothermus marinus]BBM70898.1 single-stranded-DNA-specific exonuclease RecJ [Rhodothermus marinus]BBM73877.1 single-stranded-DNA-specific exonuclease RecJ [Rhodothermus marinus]
MRKYRWVRRPLPDPNAVATLMAAAHYLPEPLARVLVARGITTVEAARAFFRPALDQLHDPFLMADMEAAARRLARAIEDREQVLVYGDYDVDGTTATALMTSFLKERGVPVRYFVPDRFRHGYGLTQKALEEALEAGTRLLIALDCGITAAEEAAYARARGVDLIICDHHTAGATLPEAVAVLDPKRPDCPYPFPELSGCAVAFKLVQATLQVLGESPEAAYRYLDLVALSTAADIVPLTGENRILMAEGLRHLRRSTRPGLQQLAARARYPLETLTMHGIVFGLAPRINAAGRLGDANRAVALLLTEDTATADALAAELDAANRERQQLDRRTLEEAIAQAERQITARDDRHALVLYHPDWHLGVIGIVASRIVERFYRPTILLCAVDSILKGSARSIAGINIYEALRDCEDLLLQFGGHTYAAGLALEEARLEAFRERFNEAVGARMTPELLVPRLEIDALLDLHTLDERFWRLLQHFGPHGPENEEPLFMARDLEVVGEPQQVGDDGKHLKFYVRQRAHPDDPPCEVIGFGLGRLLPAVQHSRRTGQPLALAFTLQENTWQGQTRIQLRLRDLKLQRVETPVGQ